VREEIDCTLLQRKGIQQRSRALHSNEQRVWCSSSCCDMPGTFDLQTGQWVNVSQAHTQGRGGRAAAPGLAGRAAALGASVTCAAASLTGAGAAAASSLAAAGSGDVAGDAEGAAGRAGAGGRPGLGLNGSTTGAGVASAPASSGMSVPRFSMSTRCQI
jgi:hypothetical protein